MNRNKITAAFGVGLAAIDIRTFGRLGLMIIAVVAAGLVRCSVTRPTGSTMMHRAGRPWGSDKHKRQQKN